MTDHVVRLGGKKGSTFMDQVKELLPDGGNLKRGERFSSRDGDVIKTIFYRGM